jgi:hypothetical protein
LDHHGVSARRKNGCKARMTVLGRDLTLDEARDVQRMARRIAAILLLGPALDASYRIVKT